MKRLPAEEFLSRWEKPTGKVGLADAGDSIRVQRDIPTQERKHACPRQQIRPSTLTTFRSLSYEADYKVIYDNSTVSGHWHHPGTNCEVLDWGTSSGGIVCRFIFRYITTLRNPGEITVRFYEGTNSTTCTDNPLAEWKFSELPGSPDGGDYTFTHDFIIPSGKEFNLPNGPFGYSFEFDNEKTGIELARGGRGNENIIWQNCTGPHHCSDPNIWAGFYMRIYTFEEGQGDIRIEPSVLNFDSINSNQDFDSEQHKSYNGEGVAIAIIDSGIDYNHPQLGGGGFPNSKVIGGHDFGDHDSDPFANELAHGTFCAGIAAGNLASIGDYIGGIAYNAKLYALKIKEEATYKSTYDELEAALDWCVRHQNDDPNYPIMVVGVSYGGKRSFTSCDGLVPGLTMAVNKAVAVGITVLASSGNNSWGDSIKCPACISNIISVGATNDIVGAYQSYHDVNFSATIFSSCRSSIDWCAIDNREANTVSLSSNTSPILDVLAPSKLVYITDIAGLGRFASGDFYREFGGTSAACAYAVGAVACLQSAAKDLLGRYLTPLEVIEKLVTTGDYIADGKIIKPRINLDRAVDTLVCNGKTFAICNVGPAVLTVSSITTEKENSWLSFWPTGSFKIKSGEYQEICVEVNDNLCNANGRLLVFSDDPNDDPYDNGVLVNVRQTN